MFDLEHLRLGMREAERQLHKAKGQRCIVIIGDIGTGKSTLVNALYYGSQGMVADVEAINGNFGIEYRENIRPREWICEDETELFKVSNDPRNFCTQYPEVIRHEGSAYCDCPGFGDSKDFEKDLVDCLAIGRLLEKASDVRLMATMTYNSVMTLENRGNGVRRMLKMVAGIFKNETEQLVDLDSLSKILIVITNPPLGNNPLAPGQFAQKQIVQKAIYTQLKDEWQLSESIARAIVENVVIVDPMDRIATQEVLTIEQLKERLSRTSPIPSHKFKVPVTSTMFNCLNDLNQTILERVDALLNKVEFEQAAKEVEPLIELSQLGMPSIDSFIQGHLRKIEMVKCNQEMKYRGKEGKKKKTCQCM